MNEKTLLIILGLIAGAALGFAGYSASEVKKIRKENDDLEDTLKEKLDMAVDTVRQASPIDIQEAVVNKAVEKAAREVVSKRADIIGNKLNAEIREDMRAQIFAEIDDIKTHYEDEVRESMEAQAHMVSVDDIREEVVEAAAKEAEKQMQNEMGSIINKHKSQLDDIAKIYNNISAAMKGD